jgi:hypothetical protein
MTTDSHPTDAAVTCSAWSAWSLVDSRLLHRRVFRHVADHLGQPGVVELRVSDPPIPGAADCYRPGPGSRGES